MASDTDNGLKYVLGGARHDGSKGRKYALWKDGFLDAAQGRGDDDFDYSWAQVFLGTDGPQAGLGAAPARKQAKRCLLPSQGVTPLTACACHFWLVSSRDPP
jgi:hypothetical protein